MEKVTHLFVYGSLRSGFKSAAYEYISKYFKLVGSATTQGILYDMGSYPVAKPTVENKQIIGELYQIINENAFDFIIAQLDDYEGVVAEDDEEILYAREKTFTTCNNVTIQAWVYWYCGNINDKPIVPSGDVLQYFLNKK